MPNKARLCCLLLLAVAGSMTAVWGQQSAEGELTARDMFRKATGRLVPAGARPPRPDPPKPPAQSTPPPELSASSRKTAPTSTPDKTTVSASNKTTPPATQQARVNDHGAAVVPISTRPPLGLRYSILKDVSGGAAVEVDRDTVFRSGDRIRLTIATTETAYVYVVTRGSSGKWRVLFPSPEIGQGSNLIPGGVIYPIPAAHWFAFDEQVGTENLFVMVSRTPEKDLDALIYKLKESGDAPPPPSSDEPPLLMASNIPPVDDSVVSRLRSEVYARDLVFEKVDDTAPAAGGETVRPERAVYVVNKTGSNDSRVVADIKLEHR